jgi:hypothetical protein
MVKSNVGSPVQAFPIKTTTQVFGSGVTAFEIKGPSIVHIDTDSQITCHYNTNATPGSIVFNALAGSDWVIDDDFDSIDVSDACIISRA